MVGATSNYAPAKGYRNADRVPKKVNRDIDWGKLLSMYGVRTVVPGSTLADLIHVYAIVFRRSCRIRWKPINRGHQGQVTSRHNCSGKCQNQVYLFTLSQKQVHIKTK